MKRRFSIRAICLLTFVSGMLIAVFQQQGPWTLRIIKVVLVGNALVALGGVVFGLYQYFGVSRRG